MDIQICPKGLFSIMLSDAKLLSKGQVYTYFKLGNFRVNFISQIFSFSIICEILNLQTRIL